MVLLAVYIELQSGKTCKALSNSVSDTCRESHGCTKLEGRTEHAYF